MNTPSPALLKSIKLSENEMKAGWITENMEGADERCRDITGVLCHQCTGGIRTGMNGCFATKSKTL
jgi:hypothetical protein|tara:strand:+ start:1926 stop:2123 length:198 start_codon:yes stop_codon:yes gene_type:complete